MNNYIESFSLFVEFSAPNHLVQEIITKSNKVSREKYSPITDLEFESQYSENGKIRDFDSFRKAVFRAGLADDTV